MEKISLIDLAKMIKQGEAAKREIERRFNIKWEDIDIQVVKKDGDDH